MQVQISCGQFAEGIHAEEGKVEVAGPGRGKRAEWQLSEQFKIGVEPERGGRDEHKHGCEGRQMAFQPSGLVAQKEDAAALAQLADEQTADELAGKGKEDMDADESALSVGHIRTSEHSDQDSDRAQILMRDCRLSIPGVSSRRDDRRRCLRPIGPTRRRVTGAILAGRRANGADTGLRLSPLFAVSDGFWVGLQADDAAAKARRALGATLWRMTPFSIDAHR